MSHTLDPLETQTYVRTHVSLLHSESAAILVDAYPVMLLLPVYVHMAIHGNVQCVQQCPWIGVSKHADVVRENLWNTPYIGRDDEQPRTCRLYDGHTERFREARVQEDVTCACVSVLQPAFC